MPPPAQTVTFLHGIGAGPNSWDAQIAGLPDGFTGFAPQIAGFSDASTADFSLAAAAAAVRDELDQRGIQQTHLCGLSLGAMVATQFAIDYPDRLSSLILSGGQVRPNPSLMRFQSTIMRLLPAKYVSQPGMSKERMLTVLGAVGTTDFRDSLAQICAPTLVLCGMMDHPNITAARKLAGGIPGAQLQLVRGAGHEWNTQQPAMFSSRLNAFLESH